MIGFIYGKAEIIESDYVIVDCDNIGYKVFMNTQEIAYLSQERESVRIYTSMYVREDIIALYGFLRLEDLKLFELLITVSGIGPKAALNIFSTMSGNDLKYAILGDDITAICKAPGIGKKTAQKLVLELKDKFSLEKVFEEGLDINSTQSIQSNDEFSAALEALISLGYNISESRNALKKCQDSSATADKLIKEALRNLI